MVLLQDCPQNRHAERLLPVLGKQPDIQTLCGGGHPNQNENRGHGLLKNKCTQEKQERDDAEKLETNEWDTS